MSPAARRVRLPGSYTSMLEVIAHGMALGHVEYYLTKPWRPREHLLYPVVGEALAAWTRLNSPGFALVRIVGDHWDPRSFGVRDALERNSVPYAFYDRGSPEGAELLQQLDDVPRNPVIFLAGGRVLTSYTRAEVAAAVGAQVRPDRRLRPGRGGRRAGRAERGGVRGIGKGFPPWCSRVRR